MMMKNQIENISMTVDQIKTKAIQRNWVLNYRKQWHQWAIKKQDMLGCSRTIGASLVLFFLYSTVSVADKVPDSLIVQQLPTNKVIWESISETKKEKVRRMITSYGSHLDATVNSYSNNSFWSNKNSYYGVKVNEYFFMVFTGKVYVKNTSMGGDIEVLFKENANPTAKGSETPIAITFNNHPYVWQARSNKKPSFVGFDTDFSCDVTNLRAKLVMLPSTPPGTYTLPSIEVEVGPCSRVGFSDSGATITVKPPPLACTISAPPVIDFGQVNLWNFAGNSTGQPGGARKDVLGVVDGELGINCNGDSSSQRSGVLTMTGVTRKYGNDLEVRMDATDSLAPATVRSSFGTRRPGCATGGTTFSNSSSNSNKVEIPELSVGQTNIPYRFSLCSFPEGGINLFGSASATATMTLDWD